ncbi:helix-turn-helix transcriptional regulator [Haloglycomyces albus]|uniref:helix-turn-helix transcriptional regulator n=1 Tax=Haloglycomyces albus TaxID=526067 RepID=UPI0004A2BD76|nr:metalloregulator ArsR/SmtB family transcription factor [Haloglycomyces albus]
MVTRATNSHSTDGETRRRVAELLLEQGHATAGELARSLGISTTATRRHLDALESEGQVESGRAKASGRGRPAKYYKLTVNARQSFGHTYDNVAVEALRWIRDREGDDAVSDFADAQVATLEARCRQLLDDCGVTNPWERAQVLAGALSGEGYVASASTLAGGGQLCQHHCPVAEVAAEFPQLCEAETRVISKLLGVHVQRLATIANGDGVCTTYVPGPVPLPDPHKAG